MKQDRELDEPQYEWLFCQWYRGAENQATEALLKWFSYSTSSAQRQFLTGLCGLKKVPRKKLAWDELELQTKHKKSVPDGKIWLAAKYVLLVEGKIRAKAVSIKQLKRHFKGAGFRARNAKNAEQIKVLLLTPDWKPPAKLQKLSDVYRRHVVWMNWQHFYHFLMHELRPKNSADRLLRDAMIDFLRVHETLKRYFER